MPIAQRRAKRALDSVAATGKIELEENGCTAVPMKRPVNVVPRASAVTANVCLMTPRSMRLSTDA
jgi:hypothetical protein